jgi:uncharacterized protein YecE (DUF72 family)
VETADGASIHITLASNPSHLESVDPVVEGKCRARQDDYERGGGFSRDVTGVHGRSGVAYFRLHGRNTAWFRKGAGRDEVYDWEYSSREIRQIGERLRRIEASSAQTLVVANNHFHGKAMKLIEDLVAWYRGGAA